MMKKTIVCWLLLSFFIGMEAQNLHFKDGKFKIVQFTDLHINSEILRLVRPRIAFMRL